MRHPENQSVCVALKLSGHETITHLSSQINEAPGWKAEGEKKLVEQSNESKVLSELLQFLNTYDAQSSSKPF